MTDYPLRSVAVHPILYPIVSSCWLPAAPSPIIPLPTMSEPESDPIIGLLVAEITRLKALVAGLTPKPEPEPVVEAKPSIPVRALSQQHQKVGLFVLAYRDD